MHGDFLAEVKAGKGKLIGGLALLSGYLNKVRQEEEHVLYVIAGDMVQGSLIDTEYKGISTIEIMNYLSPDVVALGNHEFDYGLPHLLFLEKVANFPIVNANLYLKGFGKRMMRPYHIVKIAGLELLFTGIITEKILDALKQDQLIGSFVSLEEASQEVGKICNAYKDDDIDLTVLLTHIGLDSDRELAKLLKPEWGVDMIIGGHSHTFMQQPERVNDILIAQAGNGTDQIGRYDLIIDDDTNRIVDFTWQLIPITEELVEPDHQMEAFIAGFKDEVDRKYNVVLTKFARQMTHPKREVETTLGNLLADAFADAIQCDTMLLGSGSVRSKEMGPVVTLMDFRACFPYDDSIIRYTVTGKNLKKIFAHIMRSENRNSEGECYQVNHSIQAIYNDETKTLTSLKLNGLEVTDDQYVTVAMQGYHATNSAAYLNLTPEELMAGGAHKVVTTSAQEVLEEYLRTHQNLKCEIEGRLVYQ